MELVDFIGDIIGDVTKKQPSDEFDISTHELPGEGAKPSDLKPTVSRASSAGVFTSGIISDEELSGIAKKYGIKKQKLRDMADLYGGTREIGLDEAQGKDALTGALKSSALELAGLVDEAGINVPSWLYKKLQTEEGEKAFDEVRKLVEDRRSLAGTAMRIALPGVGAKAAAGAKIGARVAAAAGLGAVSGLTASQSGEELSGAATGAATSGAMVGLLSPEAISKMQGLPVFKKIVKKFTRPETVVKEQGEATAEMIESTARRWKAKGAFDNLNEARGEAWVAGKLQEGTAMGTESGSDLMAKAGNRVAALHEYLHGQFDEIAKTAGVGYKEVLRHVNSKVDEKVETYLRERLSRKDIDYPKDKLADEIVPWMLTLANSKADRQSLGVSQEMMGLIKRDLKGLQKWATEVSPEDLKKQVRTGEDVLESAAMKRSSWPTKKELESAAMDKEFVDIPGLKFEEKQGFINTYIDGKLFRQSASFEKAKSDALKWKKENPDKLEELIYRGEGRD